MSEYKKAILTEIIGFADIDSPMGREKLKHDFADIETAFQLEEEKNYKTNNSMYLKDIFECHKDICNLYRSIIMSTIIEFATDVYGQSIDYILMNYTQENISLRLEKYLIEKRVPQQFKSDIYDYIKKLADRLNKRFSFDEVALINLIEASSGSNIILEEGNSRRKDNKIITLSNGTYNFKTSASKQIYTHDGRKILDPSGQEREEKENIQIRSFPLGNKFASTDNAMKKVMEILFENLNLCIETYNSIYSAGKNTVENVATLPDGSKFDFKFIIHEKNIPHLLGIPQGNALSQRAMDYLNILTKANGKPKRKDGSGLIILTPKSSAYDLLLVLYENQKNIIEAGGLYEENGKQYEIINWEKMILKTTSFMRGDFFKTCFCLAILAPDKYLVDSSEKGGMVSISSTEYNKDLNTTRSNASVLNDLLNAKRQKRDFIFRGFKSTKDGQVINSIVTGKAENIHVGKTNEKLKTLQRYREMFGTSSTAYNAQQGEIDSSGSGRPFGDSTRDKDELIGAVVEKVENENFIRRFTPAEQAELGLSMGMDLSIMPRISQEALDSLKNARDNAEPAKEKESNEHDSSNTNNYGKTR